jgi:superfamily II DNA/RNA helicase
VHPICRSGYPIQIIVAKLLGASPLCLLPFQAEFAPNAVDFLHRIGRTARAGKSGRVTSLYREDNEWLVDAVRSYVESGRELEATFSRNRSLARSYKRYGKTFTPRSGDHSAREEFAESETKGNGNRRGR